MKKVAVTSSKEEKESEISRLSASRKSAAATVTLGARRTSGDSLDLDVPRAKTSVGLGARKQSEEVDRADVGEDDVDNCSTKKCNCQCTWSDMVWSIGMAVVCLLATVGIAYSVLTLRNWSQFRESWSAGVVRGDFLAESIVSGRNSFVLFYSSKCIKCNAIEKQWTEMMKTWSWDQGQAALYKMACDVDAGGVCSFHNADNMPTIQYFKPGFLQGVLFKDAKNKIAEFAQSLTACNVATYEFCDQEQIDYISDLRSSPEKLRQVKEVYVRTNEVVQNALFDPNNDSGLRNEEWARASWELPLLFGVVANPQASKDIIDPDTTNPEL